MRTNFSYIDTIVVHLPRLANNLNIKYAYLFFPLSYVKISLDWLKSLLSTIKSNIFHLDHIISKKLRNTGKNPTRSHSVQLKLVFDSYVNVISGNSDLSTLCLPYIYGANYQFDRENRLISRRLIEKLNVAYLTIWLVY